MTTTYPINAASNGTKPVWPLDEGDPLLDYVRSILDERPRGFCTDIDGTISETAPTVDAAVLFPGMRELLRELTEYFDLVATISGRAVEDQRRMIDIPKVWHVGHHGYEWEELDSTTGKRHPFLWSDAKPYLSVVAAALDEIEAELAPQIPGLWMERKGITGGVHWRQARNIEDAEKLAIPVIKRIASEHGLRIRGGKLAIELFPPVVTNKGNGLRKIIEAHQIKSVFYIGDDISDTDAFLSIRHLREQDACQGLSIGVLHRDSPAALIEQSDMLVSGIAGVSELLHWLIQG